MATTRIHHDLKIEVPLEEELLAAVECALEHFERKFRHSPEPPTAAENKVVKKLRRALLEVYLRDEA